MTDKKTGGSAFPNSKLAQDQTGGMTLRDWLAGQALNGMITTFAEPYCAAPIFTKPCATNY